MKKKICLSIEQMQELKELGIETKDASMCWVKDGEGNRTAVIHDEYCYEMSHLRPVPAFTLEDMLDLMSDFILSYIYEGIGNKFWIRMEKFCGKYRFFYWHHKFDPLIESTYQENAIDAAFDMLVWLAKNGYLKTIN